MTIEKQLNRCYQEWEGLRKLSKEELEELLVNATDQRVYVLAEAFRRRRIDAFACESRTVAEVVFPAVRLGVHAADEG